MPLGTRKRARFVDVPIQDMVLRISGHDEVYEEARAAGMQFWEQIQAYGIRNPDFRRSKRPIQIPEGAPGIVRRMAETAARAGVGPVFTFQGAVTQFVGELLARNRSEVMVSCGGDVFVLARKRSRILVHPGRDGSSPIAVVVRPELGAHGIYTTMGRSVVPRESDDDVVVIAESCILADAAAAAAAAILSRPNSLRSVLTYLKGLNGVHGAVVMRGDRIGVAGNLELAA